MSDETITPLETIAAPYGREVTLKEVAFGSGMTLLRVTIREGKRITSVDVDAETAAAWGDAMTGWAARPTGGE